MSDIDWSKYGRIQNREQADVEITFRDVAGRIICGTSFPVDRMDEVIDRLKAQRDFWLAQKDRP
ncbi:hypothetical protein [Burkholderia ambifaria]|uniref:hypothetical protein n=1 Tax=Burkholderia ambifaria TaxID=152480 RepID=UPI00158BD68B|nr:hypothetical protein [Burkholderia ambifaria]